MIGFALLLASVFAHEWGHYRVFRFCGVSVKEVAVGVGFKLLWWTDRRGTRWSLRLIPIAGYTKPDETLEKRLSPLGHLLVAGAGPIINLMLAAVAIVADTFFQSEWFLWFAYLNAILAVFNLVPFWPMDGGRILFAAVQLRWGSAKAEAAELYIKLSGVGMAIAMNAYFIFGHYNWDRRWDRPAPSAVVGAAIPIVARP